MRLNSDRAMAVGRELFESSGGDWSKVHASGAVRSDGVVDLTKRPAAPPPPPQAGSTRHG